MTHWCKEGRKRGACEEALIEACEYKTLADWWTHTKRGDWMLWAAAKEHKITQGSEAHARLCWATCLIWWECAYPYWYDYAKATNDHRPEHAILALENWCRAPNAGRAADAARAALAAGYGAWAAGAAAWAAAGAPEAAAAAAAWAARAAGASGRAECLTRIAEIVSETCLVPEP